MTQLTQTLLFAAAGLVAGLAAHSAFQRLPDAWLLDYDQTTPPSGFAARRAFPMLPQGLLFTLLVAILYARIPAAAGGAWHRGAAMLAVPVLLLVLVADWKTRIIPDQLTLLMLLPGVLQIIGNGLTGTSWLAAIGLPLLAALVAGGALLAIGLFGQWLLHRDAMGMGDVKLIAAAAFMIGWHSLLKLVMLSFLTATVIAVPLLVRMRLSERRAAASSADAEAAAPTPADAAPEPAGEAAEPVDTAPVPADAAAEPAEGDELIDDPSAIAFGPFIAIAALLLSLFPTQIDQLVNAYWSLILR